MKTHKTFITQREIRNFYKDHCKESGEKFSLQNVEAFVRCCEKDFFQWLKDNLKYFESEVIKQS